MMTTTLELTSEIRRAFAKLTALAWSDPVLWDRYRADPGPVLAEFGIVIPDGAEPPVMPPRADTGIDLESLELSAAGALASIGTVSCPSLPAPARWAMNRGQTADQAGRT